jgi:hypothetical protein
MEELSYLDIDMMKNGIAFPKGHRVKLRTIQVHKEHHNPSSPSPIPAQRKPFRS